MAGLSSPSQDPDPFADRRLHPRVEVALPAFLQADGARHFVHLLDLSSGGAKLKCSAPFRAGSRVTLDCGTLARTAVVRWQNDGVLGLCFDKELDGRDVTDLIARSKALADRITALG
ncbi:MAG TPA: PilZ domain-containing protein [Sphingomicrobium sp.]